MCCFYFNINANLWVILYRDVCRSGGGGGGGGGGGNYLRFSLKDAILATLWTDSRVETAEGPLCLRASIAAVSLCVPVEVAVNFSSVVENLPLIARRLQRRALNDATGRSRKAHTFKEEEVSWKSSCAGK